MSLRGVGSHPASVLYPTDPRLGSSSNIKHLRTSSARIIPRTVMPGLYNMARENKSQDVFSHMEIIALDDHRLPRKCSSQ
jgi:hypothetical protein